MRLSYTSSGHFDLDSLLPLLLEARDHPNSNLPTPPKSEFQTLLYVQLANHMQKLPTGCPFSRLPYFQTSSPAPWFEYIHARPPKLVRVSECSASRTLFLIAFTWMPLWLVPDANNDVLFSILLVYLDGFSWCNILFLLSITYISIAATLKWSVTS